MLFLREVNQDWRLWRHKIPDKEVYASQMVSFFKKPTFSER